MTPAVAAFAATSEDLKDTAPDRYIVVEGDTLWSISGRYLKEPWRWPELWKMNQEQIKNPHRIYPGDVLVLDRSAQEARLRVQGLPTVKLTPKVRAEPIAAKAVPSISPAVIEPFLSRPLVIGQGELDSAPRIIATEENRVAIGAGNIAYAQGITKDKGEIWQIFRRGDALVDPDTRETLGYEAVYLGEARVRKHDQDIATIEITKSAQEIYQDDRLLPVAKMAPSFGYLPRAPQKSVKGRIISTYGSLEEAGPSSIVALSRGSKDGLEVGHVLAIYRSQTTARYGLRTSPLYGRTGLSGNDAPRAYYGDQLTPRDAPLYARSEPIREGDISKLPDERYGLIMVFRTFDRAAYGLVMETSRPVSVNDVVTNP
ncbi:MAG: LysM peptidoglycan-binding domain-containing protein [Burkholderiales bacterium]|nr:LysM peptidoglycan-binding domain-containing protein [Burkholderiales bacterium]